MLGIVIFMKTILVFRKYIVKTLRNFPIVHGIGAKLGTEHIPKVSKFYIEKGYPCQQT